MSRFKRNDETALPGQMMRTGRRVGLIIGLLVVLSILAAACGPAAQPAALSTAEPAMLPTAEPTAAPTAEPTSPPAAEPTSPAAPTDAPAAEAMITPSVTVADQGIVDGQVTIAQVVSDGPGWLVVHAQSDGKPGPILGYSPVASGANSNVAVQLDLSAATTTLYAMLHTDAGTAGDWEFPGGADAPVTVDGQVVSPAFTLQVPPGDEAEVEMEDFQFRPKVLVIRTGTTVKFANKDGVQHTATSDTGVWDSGYLSKGEEFFFTFSEPGVYPYYCIPHGGPGGVGMAATIIVLQ